MSVVHREKTKSNTFVFDKFISNLGPNHNQLNIKCYERKKKKTTKKPVILDPFDYNDKEKIPK